MHRRFAEVIQKRSLLINGNNDPLPSMVAQVRPSYIDIDDDGIILFGPYALSPRF